MIFIFLIDVKRISPSYVFMQHSYPFFFYDCVELIVKK